MCETFSKAQSIDEKLQNCYFLIYNIQLFYFYFYDVRLLWIELDEKISFIKPKY